MNVVLAITQTTPELPHSVNRGVLALVAALFLASILAHRYWRAKIRLEDALEAQKRDAERTFTRYRTLFQNMEYQAAFVDRVTGLVVEASPGWTLAGFPTAGELIHWGDPALEKIWNHIPRPDEQGQAAPEAPLKIQGASFLATPLQDESLGLVLVRSKCV